MDKSTPRPWKIDTFPLANGGPSVKLPRVDYEHACIAVNNFDALVEALEKCLEAMEMQEGREQEELHINQPTAWKIWTNAKFHARAAMEKVKA